MHVVDRVGIPRHHQEAVPRAAGNARLDLRTGQTRNVAPVLAYPEFNRTVWTLPLTFSRRNPRVLYFAHQHLYRTEDRGEHWTRISGDLTREDPGTPPTLDAPTAALTEQMGARRHLRHRIFARRRPPSLGRDRRRADLADEG